MNDLHQLQELLSAAGTLAKNPELPGTNETLPSLIHKCKQKVGVLEIVRASEENPEMEILELETTPAQEGRPGRPAATEELTHLGGRVPRSMKERIDAFCEEYGCKVSDAIRTGMGLLLDADAAKKSRRNGGAG